MANRDKQDIPPSLLEEFRYLNELSLARIRDANFFWISSLLVIGAITAFAIEAKSFVAILIEILMLPAFSLGIIWQLDGIARVRTYISIILEPQMFCLWEKAWRMHPLFSNGCKRNTLNSVPIAFVSIYCSILVFLNILSLEYIDINTESSYDIGCMFVLIISDTLALIFFYKIYSSFTTNAFLKYIQGWEEVKSELIGDDNEV